MRRIAIIGATGMLGIPVALALLEAGFEVTALARNPKEAGRVLPAAVRILKADVRDEASLRRGLEGQEGLHLSLSIAAGERRGDFHTEEQGLDHILAAARACAIKRIGYVSAMIKDIENCRWWVLDVWRSALSRIKASGIPYTIFYPSNLMETIEQRHMLGGALVLAGTSHYCNYWMAGEDFARQVARSFAIANAANREYFMQGPEPMTYEEAARRFAHASAASPRVVKVPLAAFYALGLLSQSMHFNARILDAVQRFPEEFKAAQTWAELGEPSITIEEFARGKRGASL
jgi:uncharacterized protein YbjT (DUF2867 family)